MRWFGGLAIAVALLGAASRLEAAAPPGWVVEAAAACLGETWDYNLSHETLVGGSLALRHGISDRWSLAGELIAARVIQRGPDAFVGGLIGVFRWTPIARGRVSLFVESGLGAGKSDVRVPPRGTRFNYLFLTGAGAGYRLSTRLHLLMSARWLHLSNNSLDGRDHNPDIQALGGLAGFAVAF